MIIQTKQYKYLCFTRGKHSQTRDWVFEYTLSQFNRSPLPMIEIGCLTHRTDGRYGNGNSTMFWAEYIDTYGGEIWTCNNNEEHLSACADVITPTFPDVKIKYVKGDGKQLIEKLNKVMDYKLVYLDGSNDPEETLQQFELSKDRAYVLIDDFNEKGSTVFNKYPNCVLFRFANCGHQMALYHGSITQYKEMNNPIGQNDVVIPWEDFKE